jgi:hypothetical protein
MDTYSIEANQGGYDVRAVGPDGKPGHVAASFPTRRQAQEWIDAQTQIAMKTANARRVKSA